MKRRLELIVVVLPFFAALGSSNVSAETRPPSPPPEVTPIEPLPPAPRPTAPAAPPDVAAAPEDAKRTSSGLASKVLSKGKGGAHPGPYDRITVHYTGWTTDGKVFDSSIPRGEPTTLPLDGVIKGWTEGVQLMVKGEKRRFWIPGDLAYGDPAKRPCAPVGALVFDVELIDFVSMPEPPRVPPDVDAVPKDAKKTASGLAYKILKHGKGREHPKAENRVEVHYSGWTPDGQMFDSSVARGQPASFPLDGVIKGWTEGVQLMVVGDKVRFWIPGALAYGDKPARAGAPAGPLVFDVELLSIK
jgi:FKBP-type peptidyl-prolyl cis-trans isomerase